MEIEKLREGIKAVGEAFRSSKTPQAKATLFAGCTANEWVRQQMAVPDPVPLWKTLWFENECAVLFADTNVGKSLLAVQIGVDIARDGRTVAYFDFELSAKQFQMRYTDKDSQTAFQFPETFMRYEVSDDIVMEEDLQFMLAQIEETCVEAGAKIAIIDNLTWLSNKSESGDAAGELMKGLIQMKRKHGMSLLVLAHTPKRAVTSKLTQNSLAGSKKIANFIDSMFAIGHDITDGAQGRYIKQIKVRSAEMQYGEDNVIKCRIAKEDAFLGFVETGYGTEDEILCSMQGSLNPDDKTEEIKRMLRAGESYLSIQNTLKASPKIIARISAMVKAEPH